MATRKEVITLHKEGLPDREIATRLNITLRNVRVRLSQARKAGEIDGIEKKLPLLQITFWVAADVLVSLEEEALARGTQRARLVRDLLTIIDRDDMYAAILDEEPSK
jgi:transcriptional regulator